MHSPCWNLAHWPWSQQTRLSTTHWARRASHPLPASTPSSSRGPGVIFNSAELPVQKVDKGGPAAAFLSPPSGVQAFWGD